MQLFKVAWRSPTRPDEIDPSDAKRWLFWET